MEEYFKNGNIVSANDLNVIRDAALTARKDMTSFVDLQTKDINNVGTATATIDSQGRLVLSNLKGAKGDGGNRGDDGISPKLSFYTYDASKSYINDGSTINFVTDDTGNMYVPIKSPSTIGHKPSQNVENQEWQLVVQRGAAGQGGNIVIQNFSEILQDPDFQKNNYYVKVASIVGDQVTADLVKGEKKLVDIEKTFNQFEVITGYGEDNAELGENPTLATVHTIQGNTGRESENLIKTDCVWSNQWQFNIENCFFLPNTKYTLSLSKDSPKNVKITCGKTNWVETYLLRDYTAQKNDWSFTTPSDLIAGVYSIKIGMTAANNDDKETRKAMLNYGDKPLPYKPYNPTLLNARGKVISTGKNLWDEQWENGYYQTGTGEFVSNPTYICNKNKISVIPNTKYMFSIGTKVETLIVLAYNSNGEKIKWGDGNYFTIYKNITQLTTPSECSYIDFWFQDTNYGTTYKNDIMLNFGTEPFPYEPYKENEYLIPELGAFDTLDVDSGTITRGTSDYITLDGSEPWVVSSSSDPKYHRYGFDFDSSFSKPTLSNNEILTVSNFKDVTANEAYVGNEGVSVTNISLFVCINSITTLEQFKSWLHDNPITLIYKLATPTTEKFDIPSAYEVVKGGLQTQELNIQKTFTINRSYAVSLDSQINATINAVSENKDSINDITERLNLNEKLDKKLVNSDRTIITGYTGGEEQLALPDTTFVEIDKIEGQTKRASENLASPTVLKVKNYANCRMENRVENGQTICVVTPTGKDPYGECTGIPHLPKGSYSVRYKATGNQDLTSYWFLNDNIMAINPDEVFNFTADKDDNSLKVRFDGQDDGQGGEQKFYDIQIVEGIYNDNTMPPYKPFDDSLVNSNCKIVSTGLNLWDEEWENGYLDADGLSASSGDYIRTTNFIPVISGKTYYLSCPYFAQIYYYDKATFNSKKIGSRYIMNSSFEIPNGVKFIRFFIDNLAYGTTYKNDIMLNYGDKPLPYEPYQSNEYVVKQELGKWDSIDVKSGTMTKGTSNILTFDGSEDEGWHLNGNQTIYLTYIQDNIKAPKDSNGLCEIVCNNFVPTIYNDLYFSRKTSGYIAIGDEGGIGIPVADFEKIKTTPFQIAYRLKKTTTTKVDLPSGYAITKGGMQIQEPEIKPNSMSKGNYLPYILTKSYALSVPSQVDATINAVAENKDYINNLINNMGETLTIDEKSMIDVLNTNLDKDYLRFEAPNGKMLKVYFGNIGFNIIDNKNGVEYNITIPWEKEQNNRLIKVVPFVEYQGVAPASQHINILPNENGFKLTITFGEWWKGNISNISYICWVKE